MSSLIIPAGGPPPLPPFNPRRRAGQQTSPPQRSWVRGTVEDTPANRDQQARATAAASRARIAYEAEGAYQQAYQEAYDRVERKLIAEGENPTEELVLDAVRHMTRTLQEAEVTINFKADEWFAGENTYDGYTQMFERHQITDNQGRRIDVAKTTPSGKPDRRAQCEEAKFLGEMDLQRRGRLNLGANTVNRFGQTEGMRPQGEYWIPDNPHFVGASRPRYAALNFTGDHNGALAAEGQYYGRSVLVLKDDVKRIATFCAGDSFMGWVQPGQFCTYETMTALIAWMPAELFEDLYAKALQNRTVAARPGKYIECHIFGPLRFRDKLMTIRASKPELLKSQGGRSLRTATRLYGAEVNLRKFCEANRVLQGYTLV